MYEALAAAIELNQGSAADVKKALYYAADLAQRTHNPNHLVSAADQLLLQRISRAGRPAAGRGDAAGPSPLRADGHVDPSRPENQRSPREWPTRSTACSRWAGPVGTSISVSSRPTR